MYYAVIIYPQLSSGLSQSIDAIRRKYDPTAGFIKPHITVLFPVPDSVGIDHLTSHIQNVLGSWEPFEMQLGGFQKSHDHWLFLRLKEGERQIKRLYQALYTGFLKEYRRMDIDFIPHIGLGLFIKDIDTHNWNHPLEMDFDRRRYEAAMRMARALPLPETSLVDKLHLISLPDQLIGWATGRQANLPSDVSIVEVQEFRLFASGLSVPE